MSREKDVQLIIEMLKSKENAENIAGMARFGIESSNAFGIKHPELREIAKPYKKNQLLAEALWETGYHECRLLAGMMCDPKKISEEIAEKWVSEMNSWDICDHLCMKIFPLTDFGWSKVEEWSRREPEFEKRAAFALIVGNVLRLKKKPDEDFLEFFEIIEYAADDNRNFVKKAVNWALRSLGKRSKFLYFQAYEVAVHMEQRPEPSARWIAKDALREFRREDIIERVMKK